MKKIFLSLFIIAIIIIPNINITNAGLGTTPGVSGDLNPVEALQIIDRQIAGLPVSAFNNGRAADEQKRILERHIKELTNIIENGAYQGVKNQLDHFLRNILKKWIVPVEQSSLFANIDKAIVAVNNAAQTTIYTANGRVAGVADPLVEAWVWKGIPFAKPPVGALRWKAPHDPMNWSKIRFSTNNYPPCTQPFGASLYGPKELVAGSEDCLYLNIFRPRNNSRNLPVYFWIHGGGNFQGAASIYWSSLLAIKLNVVVVVAQYRLGALGWLTHPALNSYGSGVERSGNFGMLDQIKALHWVQRNIAGFGGNPNHITIAGESSGGISVLNLMISPLARGLFHRAVIESAGLKNIPVSEGVQRANRLIDNLLVADGTCADLTQAASRRATMSNAQIESYLRGKSAEEIVQVTIKYAPTDYDKFMNPVIDGFLIPGTPADRFESGNYNRVPVILGCNEYEMKPFIPVLLGSTPTSSGYTWANAYNAMGMAEPPLTLDQIMPTAEDRELYEKVGKYSSLTWKEAMVDSLARSLKKHQSSVYCYLFKWGGVGSGPSPFDFFNGAGHATEVPFVFGFMTKDILGFHSYTTENMKGRYDLWNAMSTYLRSFVALGNPNQGSSGLPVWVEWSNQIYEPKCIILDADLNQAKISMMNQEVNKRSLRAQINAFPEMERNMIMSLAWWW